MSKCGWTAKEAHITPIMTRVNSYVERRPESCSFFVVTAVLQAYEARVNDEFVLRGNTAIMKCIVPSFVGDFVNVVAWIMDNDTVTPEEHSNINDGSRS